MIQVVAWYVLLILIGMAALPLGAYLFPALSDMGTAFSKALGLLMWGFIFWILCTFGVLQNTVGGAITALLIVLAISIWIAVKDRSFSWTAIWEKKKGYILIVEAIFLVCFILIALWRAANSDISGTEKPMELAFINAILKSKTFPPYDPWLSGYSISYYYFGYVLIALLIRLSGVSSSIGFSLAATTTFSLTAIGLYGLVFNIIHEAKLSRLLGISSDKHNVGNPVSGILLPLFAPLITLIMSNFEGLLEFLHVRGLFWQRTAGGSLTSSFWSWLGIQELVNAPTTPFSWWPQRPGGLLWWRASRVLTDYNLSGRDFEIIDEFPFFSFLLSDLHPHVLALPFAVLCMGVALNLIIGGTRGKTSIFGMEISLPPITLLSVPVIIGSMMFLNTWDFPMYLGVFLLCLVLVRVQQDGWSRSLFWELFGTAVILGGVSILIYLPFLIGFKSQAGGIIPSMIFSTRGIHFWIMFGTLLIPIFLFLVLMARQQSYRNQIRKGILPAVIIITGAGLLTILAGWVVTGLSDLGGALSTSTSAMISSLGSKLNEIGNIYRDLQGLSGGPGSYLVLETIVKRITQPGTWVTLLLLAALTIGLLQITLKKQDADETYTTKPGIPRGLIFVLILIFSGGLIATVPEYFYLRDQFGWRMNTIFKFYYQTWMIWSVAASVSIIYILRTTKSIARGILSGIITLTIFCGLLYPVIGLASTTNSFHPERLTLDGNDFIARYSADDYQAEQWLSRAPFGVIAESVGGSYSPHARMSTRSGLPTVIGWVPHEGQWGRGPEELGSRMPDIETLYTTGDWEEASLIIDQYHIRYIVIGSLERSTYQVSELKFQQNLPVVFQNNSVTIYETTGK